MSESALPTERVCDTGNAATRGRDVATNGESADPFCGPQPRILVLSASVGSGHVRAAEAVELALRQLCPQAHIHNADVLALAMRIFRRIYGGLYLDFIDKAPAVLRYFYNLMDRPRQCAVPSRWDLDRVFLEEIGLRRLLRLLTEQPWDLVIGTHFLAGEVVADLKRRGRLHIPQVMVTTDFETNHAWITQPCELYTTATEEGALFLAKQGVPREHIRVLGIPIHPVFCRAKSRDACRRRHGLAGDRPVLLQLAGGCGVGRIEELFRSLLDVEIPVELVVVTGRNASARQRLERLSVPPRHRAHILGYTTEIDELMRAADLIVSKPGGLTTSESLACGTPLVIVDPVPGQEERNCDLLLESGAAVKVNHLLTLGYKLAGLLRDPQRLEQLRANVRKLARPFAAFEVARHALDLLPVTRLFPETSAAPPVARRGDHSPTASAEAGAPAVVDPSS